MNLDDIADAIRAEEPDRRVTAEAGQRVWARLAAEASPSGEQGEAIADCAGFQALFSAYRAGSLTPSRRMLTEDHLHTCVGCRKQFQTDGSAPRSGAVVQMPRRAVSPWSRWAVAATLLVGVGSASWYAWENLRPAPFRSRMEVLAADGAVYRLAGGTLVPVSAHAEAGERDVLRTADGGHASLRLTDGSTVEMGPRAELYVTASRADTTIHLDRGQIIVQAAKRKTGHLYVASADSRVSVTGTVFSVNRGVAGSRVSVVEGEVQVEHGSVKNVLHAGDQVSTHSSMGRNSVKDEISWSRNYDQHLALLNQMTQLRDKLSQVQMPGLRYSSRLIDSVPQGSAIYLSLPNLGPAIDDVQRIVRDQAKQNPELGEWMRTQLPHFEKVTSQLTNIGQYLGDEIVFASESCSEFCGVLVAEVTRPGLREYVQTQLATLAAEGKNIPVRIGDPASPRTDSAEAGMLMTFAGNRVILGKPGRQMDAAIRGGTGFAQSGFGQTVADVYRRGAGLFAAADLEGHAEKSRIRRLVLEQKQVNGKSQYAGVIAFQGTRTGIGSWLASPGSMGSLSFVSSGAQFAASFLVKQPAEMLEDVLRLTPQADRIQSALADFEKQTGVSVQQMALYLGGEITVAFDGPLMPTPSWKLVAEVRDPAGLKTVLDGVMSRARQFVPDLRYAFVDGYVVLVPSQTLLDRTLQDRAAGTTLALSERFTSLLPRDSRAAFSGVIYRDAGETVRLLAGSASVPSNLVEPMLVCLYGENDRIEAASQGNAMNMLWQMLAGGIADPKGNRAANPRTPAVLRAYR